MSPWPSSPKSSTLKNATSRPCRHTPTWYVPLALMFEHRSSPERGDDEGECASGSVTELGVLVPSCHAGVRGSVDTSSRSTGQGMQAKGGQGWRRWRLLRDQPDLVLALKGAIEWAEEPWGCIPCRSVRYNCFVMPVQAARD